MIGPRMGGLTLLLLAALVLVLPTDAASPSDSTWIQVLSPHFVVVSDADTDKARQTAGDFERIRAVFLDALDGTRDEAEPVVILAVKDEAGLKELLPDYWAREGARPDGVFQPGFDKHFVVVRLDGRARARYQLIYHEYFHLLNNRSLEETPPWLNEGLAEFWGRTSIHGNEVEMGLPMNGRLFRRQKLLPLEELFGLKGNPHDADPEKVSIFYAQSWALVHYLLLGDPSEHAKTALDEYARLVRGKVDAITAARQVFGNLDRLEEALKDYVRSDRLGTVHTMRMTVPIDIDESKFLSSELPRADALAMRASFLAAGDQAEAAWPLLEEALRLDPENALAYETKGFLCFYQNQSREALRWFEKAVELGSQSYISHYYFAVLATQQVGDTEAWHRAETSLQRAVAINPVFGPGYGQLAYEYLRRDEKLPEALRIAQRAVTLEPNNVTYWFNLGHILLRLSRLEEARAVGERLSVIATTAEERVLAEGYRETLAGYQPTGPRLASTVHYDARGADIKPWIRELTAAAERHWFVPSDETEKVGHVAVEISIRRNGEMAALKLLDSSGIPALEQAAERALREALGSSARPLPQDYPDEVFDLVLVFWFNEEPYDRT